MTPRYCSQCGAGLIPKRIEDRPREVCPDCGVVYYRNPLPVACAVVLNEHREVLLVKRKNDPQKGMWCLPMGFAELGETIAEAALRELAEEAGVAARVLHLLDADSFKSDFYGDLLVVTFEVARMGGEARAGDDAEEVSWYPLDQLPTLAFSSNDKALEICREMHRDEWAIRDSFETMHSGRQEEMLSDVLINLIQEHASKIAHIWLVDVMSNPTTMSYRDIDSDDLLEKVTSALHLFGRWLKGDESAEEVNAFYRVVGQERKAKGIRHHEMLSALMLLRKHIWNHIKGQGLLSRPIDVYRLMELNRRLMFFFDKAMYQSVKQFGFIE